MTRARKLNWPAIGRMAFGVIATIFTGAIAGSWKVRSDMAAENERVVRVEKSAEETSDKLKTASDNISLHMVPREEHVQRWNIEDQMRKQEMDNEQRHFDDIVHRMDDLKTDIRDVKAELRGNKGIAKGDQ